MSVSLDINNVTKRFGKDTVISQLSLKINPGEFFTLLGPSGCGKTTLLRMIIGFNSIEAGKISVDGQPINQLPPNKRNMGMVFQNYAIFPHMSVKDNIAFGLKNQQLSKTEINQKVDEILDIVKITHLKNRMPSHMSGGQQQRVALARAIVIHPKILLMDEPLSNLDAKLRLEMRNAIKQIQQKIGITTVYVTHDQEEALAVSDRIAIMNQGVIQQVDSPKNIYQRPSNIFVSTFIGSSNILDATVVNQSKKVGIKIDNFEIPMPNLKKELSHGCSVKVSIRPEEFVICSKDESGIPATVINSTFLGVVTQYFVKMQNGKHLEILQTSDTLDILPKEATIHLKVIPHKINVFNYEGTKSLIVREVIS